MNRNKLHLPRAFPWQLKQAPPFVETFDGKTAWPRTSASFLAKIGDRPPVSRRMDLNRYLVFLAPLLSLLFGLRSHAASDANALWQAIEAQAVANEMSLSVPSKAFKAELLDRARPEDREYVKGMIISWKKNRAAHVRAEFNILRGEKLRIYPVENEPGNFRVNGAVWSLPERGSVFKSLTQALKAKAVARFRTDSIFTFGFNWIAAAAAQDSDAVVNAAYLYSFLLHSKASGTANLWASLKSEPVEVQCAHDRATGRVLISKQVINFSVGADGSVVLSASAGGEPGLPVKVSKEGEEIAYRQCADSSCDESLGPPKISLKSLIKIPAPVDVDVAITFRPRDSADPKFPIRFDCEDESDCNEMQIRDLDKMTKRDRQWAVTYRDRANAALKAQLTEHAQIVRALEPLASCCQQSACTQAVARGKIKLVPGESIHSARVVN